MTTSVAMQEQMKRMEEEIKHLRSELEKLQRQEGFERVDTDVFLTEMYNC
ncbi:MAG: hypothetical protein H0Z34_08685 [Brevibacillus sp.]|nr:hypothetical protein [Brevibacillus sp.]